MKFLGRLSGDIVFFGGILVGVNDFVVYFSMKVMLSVSKSERCMWLWNLFIGKKVGVLNFDWMMLWEVGESRYLIGEGRKVVWGNVDDEDEFVVVFDWDLIVFGMNSVFKCRVMFMFGMKVYYVEYIKLEDSINISLFVVFIEDGRIMLFLIKEVDIEVLKEDKDGEIFKFGLVKFVVYLGGKEVGVIICIKDFFLLCSNVCDGILYFVGGSSDGKV